MNTRMKISTLLVGFSLVASVAVDAQAKDRGRQIVGQILGSIARQYGSSGSQHHAPPSGNHYKKHCKPKYYCPPPQVCPNYFLGVWTTPVQLSAHPAMNINGPMAQAGVGQAAAQTPWIAPGAGQPVFALRIDNIVQFSAAQRAGLQPGDLLISANGYQLHCRDQLHRAIRHSKGVMQLLVLDGRTGQLTSITAYPERR